VSVPAVWRTIKSLLDPNTERKIKLLSNGDFSQIFNHINREQVEEKFGGTAKNVERHHSPPSIPSNNFLMENEKKEDILLTEEQYKERLKTNKFLVPSPYIEFTNILDEEASKYDDAKSNTNTVREVKHHTKSYKSEKSVYTECVEDFPHVFIEKNEDQEVIFERNKNESGTDVASNKYSSSTTTKLKQQPIQQMFAFNSNTPDDGKTTKGKKRVTIIQTKIETTTRQSCCSENSICMIT